MWLLLLLLAVAGAGGRELAASQRVKQPASQPAGPAQLQLVAPPQRVKQTRAWVESILQATRPQPGAAEPLHTWTPIGPDRAPVETWNGPFGGPVNGSASQDSGRVRTILQSTEDLNTVFVVEGGGGLWRTDNFFAQQPDWRQVSDPLPNNGGSVAFGHSDQTLYYAIGDFRDSLNLNTVSGLVARSLNGGQNWSDAVLIHPNVTSVWDMKVITDPLPDKDVLLVGTDAGLFVSRDGGRSFKRELGDGAANAIDSNPAHFWSLVHTAHGWLAAGKVNNSADTRLWRSTAADGSGWTKVDVNFNNSNNRVGLYAVPGEAVVFAVVGGANRQWMDIFRSQDSGASFVPLNVLNPDSAKTFDGPAGVQGKSVTVFCGNQSDYNQAFIIDPTDSTRNTWLWQGALCALKTSDNGKTISMTGHWFPGAKGMAGDVPYIHADAHAGAALRVPADPRQGSQAVATHGRGHDRSSWRGRDNDDDHGRDRWSWHGRDDDADHHHHHSGHKPRRSPRPCPPASPSPRPRAPSPSPVNPSPSPSAVNPSPSPSAVNPSPSPSAVNPSPSPSAVNPSPSPSVISPSPRAINPSPSPSPVNPSPSPSPAPLDIMLVFGTDGGLFVSKDNGSSWDGSKNQGIATMLIYDLGSTPLNRDLVTLGLQDNGASVRINATTAYGQATTGDGGSQALSQAGPRESGCWLSDQTFGTSLDAWTLSSADAASKSANWSRLVQHKVGAIQNAEGNIPSFAVPDEAGDASGQVVYARNNAGLWHSANCGGKWTLLGNVSFGVTASVQQDDEEEPIPSWTTQYLHTVSVAHRGYKRVAAVTPLRDVVQIFDVTELPFVHATRADLRSADAWLPERPPAWSDTTAPAWSADNGRLYVASAAAVGHQTNGSRVAYADTSEGGFFGKLTFRPCTAAGLIDSPIAQLLVDPDNDHIYAATWAGVFRSTDKCASFEKPAAWAAGFPNVQVKALALLPAADGSPKLLRAGTYGRSAFEVQL